tara:strand:- start:11493 stop:11618 length:126 start_codon:yes stop_codon:yes gene_type:complete
MLLFLASIQSTRISLNKKGCINDEIKTGSTDSEVKSKNEER